MEWYFASDVDDLVVPKDCEPLDRLPSPDRWLQWEITEYESFESLKKYFVADANSVGEELNFDWKSPCEEVDMDTDISANEQEHCSDSSFSQESGKNWLQRTTLSCERPDYKLNGKVGIDQMDDIFLSSLLEDDVSGTDNLHESFSFPPQSQYCMMPADNLLTDMILESQYIPSHFYGMGSSKYLKTHAFSPSVGWGKGEVASSCHSPANSTQQYSSSIKAPKVKVSVEQDGINGHVGEETSVEEIVLQELEGVMAQLTEKSRICFRDALYRLAKNSKQHDLNQCKKGDPISEKPSPLMVDDETLRFGRREATESETNAIDRTIANLMFNKMDIINAQNLMFNKMDIDTQDLHTATSLNFKQETTGTTKQINHSLNEPEIPCFPCFTIAGDAEVPICGQQNPQPRTKNLHPNFSSSAVNMI